MKEWEWVCKCKWVYVGFLKVRAKSEKWDRRKTFTLIFFDWEVAKIFWFWFWVKELEQKFKEELIKKSLKNVRRKIKKCGRDHEKALLKI